MALRPDHIDGLRENALADEVLVSLAIVNTVRHLNSFGGARRLIEKGGVGDGQASELDNGCLEGQQCLKPTLSNFRLVRRVGSVPFGVLEHVPADDGRRVRAIVALTNERFVDDVVVGELAHSLKKKLLGPDAVQLPAIMLKVVVLLQSNTLGHDVVDELFDCPVAELFKHDQRGVSAIAHVTVIVVVRVLQHFGDADVLQNLHLPLEHCLSDKHLVVHLQAGHLERGRNVALIEVRTSAT